MARPEWNSAVRSRPTPVLTKKIGIEETEADAPASSGCRGPLRGRLAATEYQAGHKSPKDRRQTKVLSQHRTPAENYRQTDTKL